MGNSFLSIVTYYNTFRKTSQSSDGLWSCRAGAAKTHTLARVGARHPGIASVVGTNECMSGESKYTDVCVHIYTYVYMYVYV